MAPRDAPIANVIVESGASLKMNERRVDIGMIMPLLRYADGRLHPPCCNVPDECA